MHCAQLEMLKQIQALEFTAVDLNLYLDTHPADQRALSDYGEAICELQNLQTDYTTRYGVPLTTKDLPDRGCWNWVTEPWPWQIEY